MQYTLNFGQILPHIPYILMGVGATFAIATLAIIAGCILGGIGAALLTYGNRIIQRMVLGYVNFFTNVPQLVVIFVVFYALPEFGIMASPFWAATIGLTLAETAYLCGIIKAGLASISREQIAAAEVLGLSRAQILRYVTIPHAVKVLYPSISNQFILCVLYTSIACVIGVEEITGRGLEINAQTFRSFEVFAVVGLLYVIITFVVTFFLYFIGKTAFRVKAKIF